MLSYTCGTFRWPGQRGERGEQGEIWVTERLMKSLMETGGRMGGLIGHLMVGSVKSDKPGLCYLRAKDSTPACPSPSCMSDLVSHISSQSYSQQPSVGGNDSPHFTG